MKEHDVEHGPSRENELAEAVAEKVSYTERFNRLMEIRTDPEVQRGLEALLRTGINAGISVADLFPVVGEAASWTADACKLIARRFNLPLDTSPDVSVKIALWSEVLDLCTAGLVPSHIIETTLQLRADWPRLKIAYEKVKGAWLKREIELSDPELQDAIHTFDE